MRAALKIVGGWSVADVVALVGAAWLASLRACPAQEPKNGERLLTEPQRRWLAEHPVIRYGVLPADWPPFEFNGGKQPEGISYDYLRKLTERLPVRLEPQRVGSWPELLDLVKARQIDVALSMAKTPEREQFLVFSEEYFSSPVVLVTRTDAPLIQGLADL